MLLNLQCHAVESTVADELIKRLKFADVDENAEFTTTIRACLYYHPQPFKELRLVYYRYTIILHESKGL